LLKKLYRLWTWWNQFVKSVRHHDAVTVIKLVILEQAVPVELGNLKTLALIGLRGSKISHGFQPQLKSRSGVSLGVMSRSVSDYVINYLAF
jgi:hypothetical protein